MTIHQQQQQQRVIGYELISETDRRTLERLYELAVGLEQPRQDNMRLVLVPHIAPGLREYRGYGIQRHSGGGNGVMVTV